MEERKRERRGEEEKEDKTCWKRVYINTHSEQGRGPTAGEAPKGPSSQWARGRSERLEKFWGGGNFFGGGGGENFLVHFLWCTMCHDKDVTF